MKKLLALKNKKGFTLIELIVVIAIIAVLIAIAVPSMTNYIDKANKQTAAANCRSVVSAALATNAAFDAGIIASGGTWGNEMNGLLGSSTFGSFGGGTYSIKTGAGTTEVAAGDTAEVVIHSVTWTKGTTTATWEKADNEMTVIVTT